jgi:hypothetical protein
MENKQTIIMLRQEKMKAFEANLDDLQPSQLYISSDKLAAVERTMREHESWHDAPVSVKRLASRTVLTDGHTRALAAFRQGRGTIRAYWETEELDWEAYQVCVQWCVDEGIQSVADLEARIVTAKQYEELWLKRCRFMHDALNLQRNNSQGTTNPSNTTSDTVPNAASEAVQG